jgi:sulfite exporter TauE/SafE
MTTNVGTIDRIARIVLGIALIAFALGYIAPGTSWSWVGWIGVLPILTAVFSTCPAYSLLGCSTR